MKWTKLFLTLLAAAQTVYIPVANAEAVLPENTPQYIKDGVVTSPFEVVAKSNLVKYSGKPFVNFWNELRPLVDEQDRKPIDDLLLENPNLLMPKISSVKVKLPDGREGVRLVISEGSAVSSVEFDGSERNFVKIDGVSFNADEVSHLRGMKSKLEEKKSEKKTEASVKWGSHSLISFFKIIEFSVNAAWGDESAALSDQEKKASDCRHKIIGSTESNPQLNKELLDRLNLDPKKVQAEFTKCKDDLPADDQKGVESYLGAKILTQASPPAQTKPKTSLFSQVVKWAAIGAAVYLGASTLGCFSRIRFVCKSLGNPFKINYQSMGKKANSGPNYSTGFGLQ
jgi:hypothetical protein